MTDSKKTENMTTLKVSRLDAVTKLRDRVELGRQINSASIINRQILDESDKAFEKWDIFNHTLLKTLFTSSELPEEYGSFLSAGSSYFFDTTFQEELDAFHCRVNEKIHRIESIIERLELIPEQAEAAGDSREFDKGKVFIVHGHDDVAKLEVARFIEKIGFAPIILHEQVSGSKTIIEKIETYSDVGFGVVIYTPCDVGAKKADSESLNGRARQNVVFEHGFLIGKLGRERVCPLVKGKVETPNDISGVVYTPMEGSGWQLELAKELRAAGYPVDMNKVI